MHVSDDDVDPIGGLVMQEPYLFTGVRKSHKY